jgi:hypothetical protein
MASLQYFLGVIAVFMVFVMIFLKTNKKWVKWLFAILIITYPITSAIPGVIYELGADKVSALNYIYRFDYEDKQYQIVFSNIKNEKRYRKKQLIETYLFIEEIMVSNGKKYYTVNGLDEILYLMNKFLSEPGERASLGLKEDIGQQIYIGKRIFRIYNGYESNKFYLNESPNRAYVIYSKNKKYFDIKMAKFESELIKIINEFDRQFEN